MITRSKLNRDKQKDLRHLIIYGNEYFLGYKDEIRYKKMYFKNGKDELVLYYDKLKKEFINYEINGVSNNKKIPEWAKSILRDGWSNVNLIK